MKPTLKLGLNIQFCGQEAEAVEKFKAKNPVIKHREIYLAGIKALGGEQTKK